jgi:two-component system CheB/CheR fusion protein
MGALIDTVHFYMRLDGSDQEIPKDVCDVGAVLQEAKENAGELIRERKLVIANDPLPFVKANRMQLLQVLQNLLCNAIYHCGDIDPRIRIEVADEAGLWAFRFIDNGCGISEEARKKIFEPFTRLDGHKSQGLGLGLAICKKIVESHGGTIRCESAPGGGSAFIFTLPKAEPKVDETGPIESDVKTAKNEGAAMAGRLANVLLVDDNHADLKLVQIMLGEVSKLRCNFLVAQDAKEALNVLHDADGKSHTVDLILLDINMPGMSGLELLDHMRQQNGLRHMHVVICSSSAYDKDITRAAQLGALGYITKPVEMTKLAPLLSKATGLLFSSEDDGFLLVRAA